MNQTPTKFKKFLLPGIVIVAIIIIAGVFIAKGNSVDQSAALYKSVSTNAFTQVSTTPPPACLTGSTTPTMHVISPNGGETFTAGQQITVKWSSCNIPGSTPIKIFLGYYVNGIFSGSGQLLSTTNTGSATVVLNTPIPQYGNFFKITVTNGTTIANGTALDVSDSLFTITNPAVPPMSVTLVSTDFTAGSATVNNTGVFKIKFKVTAGDVPIYVASQASGGGAGGYPINTTAHAIDRAGVTTTGGVAMVLTNVTDYSLDTGSGLNEIDPGSPEIFDLTVSATVPISGAAGLYRLFMTGLKWGTDPNDPTPNNLYSLAQPFSTGYFVIN